MDGSGADGGSDRMESTGTGATTAGVALARTLALGVATPATGGSGSAPQAASRLAAIVATSSARGHGFGNGGIDALWPKHARRET